MAASIRIAISPPACRVPTASCQTRVKVAKRAVACIEVFCVSLGYGKAVDSIADCLCPPFQCPEGEINPRDGNSSRQKPASNSKVHHQLFYTNLLLLAVVRCSVQQRLIERESSAV